jgi:branched-chain amino acid aminotransferase
MTFRAPLEGRDHLSRVNAAKFIWMDGKLVPWDEARVHVLTHTLHYGLGAFEGLRCYKCEDGRSAIFRLREHMVRLWQSRRSSR